MHQLQQLGCANLPHHFKRLSFPVSRVVHWVVILTLAMVFSIAPAVVKAQTRNAPLDTLVSDAPATPWANQANLDISRKVLPDVQATTLPKMAAPQHPPRLDDPLGAAYQFYLAQQAAAGGNFDMAAEKLRAAHQADPSQSRYHWWQAGRALRQFDPGSFLWTLPKAVRTALTDPLARKRLFLMGHQATILYLAIFWSLLVVAYLCRYWRYLCHDLSSLLFRDPEHRLRLWIAWILPIGFLLLRPGWIGMLALLSIPLCLQARGRARWPLLTVWIIMILLTFPKWTHLRRAIPPIDPNSETTLLVRATELPPDSETCAEFRRRLAVARDPARQSRLKLALAIQTARNGQYTESNSLFKEILTGNPDHIAARVGLANNIYYVGRFDVALREYEIASGLAPEQGEIPYNMAQAYFKKLFLPEGGDALKLARSLGFDPPTWEDTDGRANGFSPVVFLGFTHDEIEASAAWEADLYQPMIHLAAWRHWLGCPPVPLFAVLLVSLVLALGLVYGWSNQRDPRNCQNCGWTICQDCCSIHEDTWLCHKCGETAARSKSEMVMVTLLKNRSRNQGLARVQRLSLLGRFVPGAGHIAIGSLYAGLIRIVLLTTGLFLALFGWIFDLSDHWIVPGLILAEETSHALWWPFPNAAWPGWTGSSVVLGLLLVVLVYILALFDSSHIRQQLPKRLHATSQEHERMPKAATRKLA